MSNEIDILTEFVEFSSIPDLGSEQTHFDPSEPLDEDLLSPESEIVDSERSDFPSSIFDVSETKCSKVLDFFR